ncbi:MULTISPECIES: PRTRC system ThiF family protein [unclassified Dyella]|uniref:PRTRC system ThiF family protein n=1 Tax=Dyella sp. ASV21 TaxID=2795114 RepID=UPI0018EC454D|nr:MULTISPECIES: PRTRC system ThiF family protein [unclassified Dyella]
MSNVFPAPTSLIGSERTRVTVVGLGGTGSHFAEGLARLQHTLMALGHPGFDVTLMDGDTVGRANVGRQRFYEADIGASKVMCLVQRINQAYGFAWKPEHRFFAPNELRTTYRVPDLLVTCTDKAAVRAAIGQMGTKAGKGLLWLDFGNGPKTGQVMLGHLGDCEAPLRLPNVFDLYPELASMEQVDSEEPSCSMEEAITRQEFPINQQVAMLGISMLWTLIRHGQLDHHGYHVETHPAVITRPMKIDPEAWAFYGYQPKPKKGRKKD